LTTLGIAVGVAAEIWAVAIGEAGTARARQELARLGDSFVWIEAGSRNVNGVRTGSHGTTTLTPDDADAIRREVPEVKAVSENVDGSVQLVRGQRNWTTRYRGVSPEYASIKLWRVTEGAFFGPDQVLRTESVVVLGQTARQRVFGDEPAVGEVIRVSGFPFRVIGVLEAKGQSNGRDEDDVVMIPWTAVERKLRGRYGTWLDDILCSAVSMAAVDPAITRITALLRQRHGLRQGADDDFNVRRPDEIMKAQVEASRTLELLLAALAGIALLVGGVGVMNVMLASVAQRTAEIGVRMAVGATTGGVLLQFLGEAVLLGLAGGVLGLALAAGAAPVAAELLGWPVGIDARGAALAVACAGGVGVAAGFFPAWRAARLDPIAALRGE
jgi:putative ABC transport system permease protein